MGAEVASRVVLVVEDEPLVRANISDELRTYGGTALRRRPQHRRMTRLAARGKSTRSPSCIPGEREDLLRAA